MAVRELQPGREARAVRSVVSHLEEVRASLLALESSVDLASFGARRDSARNLLHYLAFRRFDLRRDQTHLAKWALSSLGRSESHVLYTLDTVLAWLREHEAPPLGERSTASGVDPVRGREVLERNAQTVLGPTRRGRTVRIMVTMPSEAAVDYRLVHELMRAGMDSARINCAHDDPPAWSRMIAHIHRAERALHRRCWIDMDLAGPKIRTGPMRPGPSVVKVRPSRDKLGRVTGPAVVWLIPPGPPRAKVPAGPALLVQRGWLRRRGRGERIRFTDARGARRSLRVLDVVPQFLRASLEKTAYVTAGTRLIARRDNGRADATRVGPLPAVEQRIRLGIGDRLTMTARPDPGAEAQRNRRGRATRPARIACTLPEAFRFVHPGEPIWLDDGRIGGVVRSANMNRLLLEVTHAPPTGAWLGADKGINLPETALDLPPLTRKDREDLRFVARHADTVGYSFVHRPSDIADLRAELARLGRPRMGILLKVETRRAFEELPGLLLASLRQPPVGVMIARGDLAVEVGFERLSEVQEEILWLCEAAHLPAIWATQVLEGLTKTGLPTRAEVTDAAMGERAECVMLNKGPHVVEAVHALNSILHRMQSHQSKKMSMLRHLMIVERFVGDSSESAGGTHGRRANGPRR